MRFQGGRELSIGGAPPPARESLCPLLRGTVVPLLYTLFAMTGNHSSLILKGSPTSNTPTAGKDLQLACTGASYGMGLQATGFS